MRDPDALVTVERFADPMAAQLARSRVEAEGIECFLADAGLGSLHPYDMVVGIRLQVRARDAARAREILGEAPPASFGEEPGERA